MQSFKLFTLPNMLTLLNLSAGFFAILLAAHGAMQEAGIFIIAAGLFDFLDGFTARLTQAFSPIGGDLDSLADLVSFGLAPGMISYALLRSYFLPGAGMHEAFLPAALPALTALLIPLFSALRLAKFNIDTRQQTSFVGLPTPAHAFFYASLPFILQHVQISAHSPFVAALVMIFNLSLSILLIVEFPMFSLKFKSFAFKNNPLRYSFLAGSLLLFIFLGMAGIAVIILLYILVSAVLFLLR